MSTPQWSKEVEAGYFRTIPKEALLQSLKKPFSTSNRSSLLVEFGTVLGLLPEPPARILDLGCGTGWTSALLARCGYRVTGTDLSVEAIEAAQAFYDEDGLDYLVHDFDHPVPSELGAFDAVVFFDCLHHSESELPPIGTAFLALRPGGVCVVCEPGRGHATSVTSVHAHELHGVRERDMPPTKAVAAAKAVGFSGFEVFPHPQEVARNLYGRRETQNLRQRLLATRLGEVLRIVRTVSVQRRHWGVVRLTK